MWSADGDHDELAPLLWRGRRESLVGKHDADRALLDAIRDAARR